MLQRSWLASLGFLLLGTSVHAQSTVRPLPRLVRHPEMGAALLGRAAPRAPLGTSGLNRFATDYEALRDVPELPSREDFTHFELNGRVYGASDMERGPGDVEIQRAGWHAVLGERVGEDTAFFLQLDAEASFYDFASDSLIVPGGGDPLNDVYETSASVSMQHDPFSDRSWFAGAEVMLSGEDEADVDDSLSFAGIGGLRYRVRDDFALSLGLAARTRLEDDTWIWPFLGFDWQVSDDLRLQSRGSEVELTSTLSESFELSLEAAFDMRQYRFNDDGVIPDGVLQDEEITASLGLAWKPRPDVKVELQGGAVLWRELNTLDVDGNDLAEIEADVAPFVGLSVSVSL